MLEHRVQLKVEDWDDVTFREAVDHAWDAVRSSPDDVDSLAAAAHLQLLIQANGYPEATVEVRRSVDEALAHVAHFHVRRVPAHEIVQA